MKHADDQLVDCKLVCAQQHTALEKLQATERVLTAKEQRLETENQTLRIQNAKLNQNIRDNAEFVRKVQNEE